MSTKYPTIAFNAKDVQDLLEAIVPHVDGLVINLRLSPTPKDPLRLQVIVAGFRRVPQIGLQARLEVKRYISSKSMTSLDRVCFDALWEMINLVDAPPSLWGTYTELAPGFPRSAK